MKILITGHDGYIGTVMAPRLLEAGHEVYGLDTGFYEGCAFGDGSREADLPAFRMDVRAVRREQLEGFDAVVHLAALSNDPLGDLDPKVTYEVNHRASVRLARLAKEAGVERFLFASSCSLYGTAGDGETLDESAPFDPITPYGETKVMVERDLSALAGDDFSPTYMRNATVYGVSPRLRADIVVNNLVGLAHVTGEILMKSDGTPWRPLVHVEDVCRAFRAALEAPRGVVHDEAINVGRTEENYRIRRVAELVAEAMPETEIAFAENAGPDPRNYRVDCSKLAGTLPEFRPRWTVPEGIRELRDAFRRHGLTEQELTHRYVRLQRISELRDQDRLDDRLRWREPNEAATPLELTGSTR